VGSNGINKIVKRKEVRQLKTIVYYFFVCIITDDIDILSLGPILIEKLDEPPDAFFGIYGARRVVRAIE
jgi:hypothetical protein